MTASFFLEVRKNFFANGLVPRHPRKNGAKFDGSQNAVSEKTAV
jgi:hypothetical protein